MNIHELAKKLSPYILKEHQRQDKVIEAMRLMERKSIKDQVHEFLKRKTDYIDLTQDDPHTINVNELVVKTMPVDKLVARRCEIVYGEDGYYELRDLQANKITVDESKSKSITISEPRFK